MWEERRPVEGETVKVEFAEWTKKGTQIGVFLKYQSGRAFVDFGNQIMWLGEWTTFFVFDK